MKKVLPLFVLTAFLMISGNMFGQISFTPSDTMRVDSVTRGDLEQFDFWGHVNSGASHIDSIDWRVTTYDVPAGWVVGFCDNQQCYDPSTSSSNPYPNPVAAMGTCLSKAQFSPHNHAGLGRIGVDMWLRSDKTGTLKTRWFILNITAVRTAIENASTENNIRIYPNPVVNHLMVENLSADVASVEIYDMLGSMIMSRSTDANDNLDVDVSGLGKGIYFAKLNTRGGKTILTKRFTKVD